MIPQTRREKQEECLIIAGTRPRKSALTQTPTWGDGHLARRLPPLSRPSNHHTTKTNQRRAPHTIWFAFDTHGPGWMAFRISCSVSSSPAMLIVLNQSSSRSPRPRRDTPSARSRGTRCESPHRGPSPCRRTRAGIRDGCRDVRHTPKRRARNRPRSPSPVRES